VVEYLEKKKTLLDPARLGSGAVGGKKNGLGVIATMK